MRTRHSAGLLASTAALAVAASSVLAAADLPPVSLEALQAHHRFLADDALEGREPGTRGYRVAALYVASQFEQLGLRPAGDDGTFLQTVPFLTKQVDRESVSLEVVGEDSRQPLRWADHYLMSADPKRARTRIEAPVVLVGHGIVAPELGYDDYAGLDVEGAIVLIVSGAPAAFPHDQRAHYSSGRSKYAEAVSRGAVGILSMSTRVDEARRPWERKVRHAEKVGRRWLDGETPNDFHPEIQCSAGLGPEGARVLLAAAGVDVEEVLDQAEDGSLKGRPLGIRVSAQTASIHERADCANVAALLPGRDPVLRDEVVIYTAHLDHLGVGASVDGDAIYNGAYDNAMGVSILLETARLLSRLPDAPRRSVLFLAVTGEESGLLGSDYFAHFPTVQREGIVATVNLDMPIFLHRPADVVAFGAEHSSLAEIVDTEARKEGLKLADDPMPEEVIFVRSDQYSFVRQGIPSVFLVPGMTSQTPATDGLEILKTFLRTHYHSPSDDLDLPVDWEAADQFTRINTRIGLAVANETSRPTWNSGDFFGNLFGNR